jgi:hypothetical protein
MAGLERQFGSLAKDPGIFFIGARFMRDHDQNRTDAARVDVRRSGDCQDRWTRMNPLGTASIMTVLALIGSMFIGGRDAPAKAPRPPDICDRKELSVDDVRDILAGKATINHYSMSESDPGEGCTIGVTGNGWALVDISIREGDVQSFQNLIFFVPQPRTPVPGIGDEAFGTATRKSNVPNAKETDLFARKGRLQCIVQLHRSNGDGEKLVAPASDSAVAGKLGLLCKKLFAAHAGT